MVNEINQNLLQFRKNVLGFIFGKKLLKKTMKLAVNKLNTWWLWSNQPIEPRWRS